MTLRLPPIRWNAYCRRLEAELEAGWLSHARYLVAKAIANLWAAGEISPTVEEIAAAACCAPRTVRRARAVMRERGLLDQEDQFVLIEGRPQQRASRNHIQIPTTPVLPKPKPPRGGQSGRPSKQVSDLLLNKTPLEAPAGGVDLLLARRRVMEQRLAARRLL